ncbi:hypothetical protein D1815_02900 [Aquimarina sp. AD1]|uniref:hypothetical protein n=1 Tax=Aquimarina sp. (strain AD1) TaxID=1714848 RepID=UPI000E4BA6B6|nr:hypothetical protein [Aquimarina sp. AD1]AXT54747.1 hypothetical protein D1815_02900 [Aquimarina sp. AD1]RKN13150.1 hypothetical protein D7035_17785 [Aquimarina sp. AD1]
MKTYLKDIIKENQLNGIIVNKNEVVDYFNNLSPDPNSFISIINDHNDVLRFSWIAEQKWLVEYPIITNQIHQQRYANESESLILINRVNDNESFDHFDSFIQVPVQEFTLDEVLEFKEEDQYLLREEEPPTKKVIIPKKTISKKKKISKPSIILGDIVIPKEEPRIKSITRVPTKKKKKTSPLKQFKESTTELKKEKQQPSTTKVPITPVTKKVPKPKPTKDKTNHTSLLNLGKTTKPKKDNKPSLVMGEQLGKDRKKHNPPTPPKVKTKSNTVDKNKPASNDNSLFSI